ncbi:hypothetical protein CPC08DRAFT_820828 [Agrocybe pediades]|nr:hypothetical protein CPC08DRAFT_820828 [Agrocybe pediades]
MSRAPALQRLPPELLDKIIDCFADDVVFMRSCASACRVFLARCQFHIFYNLALTTDPEHPETKRPDAHLFFLNPVRFRSIIKDSPHIADYVHNLRIASVPQHEPRPESWLTHEEREARVERENSVAVCLDRLRNLRSLSVDSGNGSPIFGNPILWRAIQDAIMQSNLVCLDQSTMVETVFRQRAHLTCLSFTIDRHGFPISSAGSASQRFDPPRCSVNFLRVMQSKTTTADHHLDHFLQRAIDIKNLECLYIVSETCHHYTTAVKNLFQVCSGSLRRLIFEYEWFGTPRSWSFRHFEFSLENLHVLRVFHVRLGGDDAKIILNSFVGLLVSLPTGNASFLQELSVHVNYSHAKMSATEPVIQHWQCLWNVATNVERFPRLQKLVLKGYFSQLHEYHTPANVVHWKTHYMDVFAQPRPEKLKVTVEILKFDDAFNDASQFWPYPGFDNLIRLR